MLYGYDTNRPTTSCEPLHVRYRNQRTQGVAAASATGGGASCRPHTADPTSRPLRWPTGGRRKHQQRQFLVPVGDTHQVSTVSHSGACGRCRGARRTWDRLLAVVVILPSRPHRPQTPCPFNPMSLAYRPTLHQTNRQPHWARLPNSERRRVHSTLDYRRCCLTIERLDRLLTNKQITAETGISRSTIYRLLRNGAFPKPIRIGPRSMRWLASDIKAWLVEGKALSLNVAGGPAGLPQSAPNPCQT